MMSTCCEPSMFRNAMKCHQAQVIINGAQVKVGVETQYVLLKWGSLRDFHAASSGIYSPAQQSNQVLNLKQLFFVSEVLFLVCDCDLEGVLFSAGNLVLSHSIFVPI